VDLFDVARACARRWWVFLPLLLIVGWFSYDAYSSVKPVYYANAVIGIAPPSTKIYNAPQGVSLPRNGLLDIGGADLIANMAAVGLREPSAVDRVVEGGGIPDYVSRMFPVSGNMSPLPLVMIESTNADAAAVTRTLELVIAQSQETLRSLQEQAQVPRDQMVAPFVVSPPSVPAAGMPARTRSTIAIFVAGAALSVLLTVVADALLSRLKTRRRRRLASPEAAAEPVETPAVVPQPDQAANAVSGAVDAR
jgi:hypothetical protein